MKGLLSLAAATLAFGLAMPASAAITFETDEAGFVSVGSVSGTQTGGVPQGPFAGGGTTFTIDADTFIWNGGNISLNDETNIEITQNSEGLGVDNNNGTGGSDGSDVDGFGSNDILIFSFLKPVKLFDVIFENVSGNDDFVFYLPGATPSGTENDIVGPFGFGDEGFFSFGGLTTSTFGIGALGGNDDFRVSSIDVAAVPLPAAGFVLLSALAGAGVAYRRRKTV